VIKIKKKTFTVIGLGLFGASIAKTLAELGQEVIAIDSDMRRVENIKEFVTHARQADITDVESLKEAGVGNCDIAIVAKYDEKSILTTIILKELGVPMIVARSRNPLHALALQKVGATRIIFPEKEFGVRLANQLISSDLLEYFEISKDYSMKEVPAPKSFFGKAIRDIHARDKYGVVILSIKRGEESLLLPHSTEIVQKGDHIAILGRTRDVDKFNGAD
jgi:trk system potassium uptake protein TrkA